MNSAQLYKTITSIVKKEVYGAVKPNTVQDILNGLVQPSYMEDLIGRIKDYQPGRPVPRIHLEATQRVDIALAPFMERAVFNVTNGFGDMDQYGDFLFGPVAEGTSALSGCETDVDKMARYPLSWVSNSEWNDLTTSLIDKPTFKYPIGRLAKNKHNTGKPYMFQVMPTNLNYIECIYIRKPKDIIFGGSFTAAGFIPDVNVGVNQDPEWNDLDMKYIIGKTVLALGMPLDDDAVKQYGIMIEREGV